MTRCSGPVAPSSCRWWADLSAAAWTNDELRKIGTAEELKVASLRPDGTLSGPRTIWVVAHDGDVFVRSVNGPTAVWYQGVLQRRQGHIRAGGIDEDVTFLDADDVVDDELDAAYRTKYQRYSPSILDPITSLEARSTTLKLSPARPRS